jgi:hypothetical protein
MGTLTALFGIGLVLSVCAIVAMWSQWPDTEANRTDFLMSMSTEQAERIGTMVVMVETLLDTSNDAINRLRLLADSDQDVDTAVSNLVWARDYVLTRMAETGEALSTGLTYPANAVSAYPAELMEGPSGKAPEWAPGYHPELALCGAQIWGTPADIDSGLRKHMDTCEKCQAKQERLEPPF